MVFSSSIFLLYFLPIFLVAYFLVDTKYKNHVALLASLVFYGFGSPKFLVTLLVAIIIDFFIVREIDRSEAPKRRKLFLVFSIILNLGLLAYFKYANFFIDNINALLSAFGGNPIKWTRVILPIGISFFTFQKLSYSVDVYRKTSVPLKSIFDYALFIMLFPQLIAGPIVRYCEISEQIRQRDYRWSECLHGFYRFVIGLCKKILIADVLGTQVDLWLAGDIASMGFTTAWITVLAYSLQLYFDFSGYSDMAIGLGRIMGFKFPENFDNPYNSASINEFWRRWHQTLGVFMRNYLYIPLGGNRVSKSRTYFNLWVVFLLSGLWHGANWNFVIWGVYHGLFIVSERLFLNRFYERIGRIPSVILTFFIVVVGWAIFRIENLNELWIFLGKLFSFNFSDWRVLADAHFFTTLVVALFFSFFCLLPLGRKVQQKVFYSDYSNKGHAVAWVLAMAALVFCIAALNAADFSPFIYFRF